MTRERNKTAARIARIAAFPALVTPALAIALAAQAQTPSVQDYRLPPAAPSPSPTAAGPVDSDHPVAAPTRSTPEASPAAAPSPVIVLPSPAVTPQAVPIQRVERPRAETAAPAPAPSATAAPLAPAVLSSAAPVVAENTPAPTASEAAPKPESAPWPWIAGGAALALLAGGFLVWRRRSATVEEAEWEPLPTPVAGPEPSPPATLTHPSKLQPPRAKPAPAPAPQPPEPSPSVAYRPLELTLEARHLSRALVNASLAYRLTLTNHADTPAGPLRIAGDIVSAHASLTAEEQLDPLDVTLEPIHEVATLAPGESATLSGELRIPIASILPITSGSGRVFVPLARFRAEAADGTATTRVFVIGQASEQPGGALRPFPLDRGPGVDRAIGQRELGVPA